MERIDVMKEYYSAITDNRIKAFYQPVYRLHKFSTITAAEALCRIVMKDGSIMMPDKFIPILEETGEICTLDWIMIDRVCSAIRDIHEGMDPGIVISVNFSRCHVEEWDAVERLVSVAEFYGIPHDRIEIEITETYKTDDFLLIFMMKRLRSEGFRVAIDDFGDGYNSLKFIKEADFDTIKLDRSIIKHIGKDNSGAIIKGFSKMAEKLGVRLIAEGIESPVQAAEVSCNGCTHLQGNYLSKPIPRDEFYELILKNRNEENIAG